MPRIDFLILFQCILDFCTETVRDLIIKEIRKKYNIHVFKDYIKIAKHRLYHQCHRDERKCCQCKTAFPIKPGHIDTNVFNKLFADVKVQACSDINLRRNGSTRSDIICICKYKEKNISITDLDLCDLRILCRYSPIQALLTTPEENHLDALMNIRNKVCHAISTKCFSESELNSMWTDVSKALCTLSPIEPKFLTMIIEDKRQRSLCDTIVPELLLKVNTIEMNAEVQIDQNKRCVTALEDIRNRQDRMEEEMKKYQGQALKCLEEIKQSVNATSSASTSTASNSASVCPPSTSGHEPGRTEKDIADDPYDGGFPYCKEHSKTTSPKQKDDKQGSRMTGLGKRLIADEGSKMQSEPQGKKRKGKAHRQ